ncbi:MAG TPA: ABC transporter permease [Candidatus Megaira endosymbiont of Hartmannula sinica]|nr:ABC transporter permease [Candidatus Megaera endosymbiont of Hartmannula sinica]
MGASISAEHSSMKVSEQKDALVTLATNPFSYLVLPRLIAIIISMPILVLMGDVIGIMGGYIIAIYQLGFNSSYYIDNTINFIEVSDVTSGLIKSIVFGFIVTITSCYCSFNANGGARGVGVSVTNSVVISSILILIANYFITALLF